ncbi:hypothetical protein PAXRUDRAFT_315241 [Paxillus rubicundulus Ve08.2h10]|uniref:Uncharacterized protein n=1 Tax=Paxillus rubicundulus Ve08.2h10 TaxID=930991 RepID=A0A0D0DXB7_9AGAM|nr:hypothetical protein PAXRUDRAFT_315241 [Paxillus rubicundulus Ve08.2h10]
MHSFFSFSATALIAACVSLASAFEPGSDYGVYKTTNLYNCTGHIPFSNVTVPNAADTLPQIIPSSRYGWEQWTLFMHGTFPAILRWTQGDPSSSTSGFTKGELSYTIDKNLNRIAVGENSLTWDPNAEWYNATVKVNGYSMQLDTFSATLDSFHPNVAFYNGMLDYAGWYGSVPLIRGHVVGSLDTPIHQQVQRRNGLGLQFHILRHARLLPDRNDQWDRYSMMLRS